MSYTDALKIINMGTLMLSFDHKMTKDTMLEYAEALRVVLQHVEQETI